MKKVNRRTLFYSLIGIFIVATPIVLAYAIGYSIDFRSRSLIPAGGIFLKTNQTGLRIFVNGKEQAEQKETSFLSSGALFNNLRAGTYVVRIEKDGFRPWERRIAVQERVVSEYRNIFLVPKEVPIVSRKEVSRIGAFEYTPSPGGQFTALLFGGGAILTIERDIDHAIIFRKESKIALKKLRWIDEATLAFQTSTDGYEWGAILITPESAAKEFKVALRRDRSTGPIIQVLKNPRTADGLLALSSKGALYDIGINFSKSEPILEQVVYAAIPKDKIVFVTDKGFLADSDLLGKNISVIGRPGFFLRGNFESWKASDGSTAVIDGVGGVFIFDRVAGKIIPAGSAGKKVSFRVKDKVALIQRERGLSILFLIDEIEAPFRKIGTVSEILENYPEKIVDSIWYGKSYIIFSTIDGVYGVEFGTSSDDIVMQKLASIGGFLFTDNERIMVINDKGTYTLAIE